MLRRGQAMLVLAVLACREPTEIVLEVSTDVPCPTVALNHVSIRLGPSNALATAANATTIVEANSCDADGGVGSLVAIPSGSRSDLVGIAVVLGVTEPTSSCDANPAGCIVARRSLRYDPSVPLHLPIELRTDCLGKVCSANETCRHALCVPDDVPSCAGATCSEPGTCDPPPLAANMPAPVLAWHFDEGQGATTQDASKTLAPVAVPPSAWTVGPGACGGALHLDGTFSVVLGDHPALAAPSGMTLSYWVRETKDGTAMTRATANAGFDVLGACVELYATAGPDTLCPLPPIDDGAWHQVSVSIKGNGTQPATVRLRVDAADMVFASKAPYEPAQGVPVTIPQGALAGDIDEVLVYDQPL